MLPNDPHLIYNMMIPLSFQKLLFGTIEFLKEALLMSLYVQCNQTGNFPETPRPASGAKNKLSENEYKRQVQRGQKNKLVPTNDFLWEPTNVNKETCVGTKVKSKLMLFGSNKISCCLYYCKLVEELAERRVYQETYKHV